MVDEQFDIEPEDTPDSGESTRSEIESIKDTTSEDSSNRFGGRGLLCTTFAVLLIAILANVPLRYREVDQLGKVESAVDFIQTSYSHSLPIMAGFPFRFSIHFEEIGSLPARREFSILALAANVGVWSLLIALFFVYGRYRGRRLGSKGLNNLSIADLLLLTLLISAPLGWWQFKRGERERVDAYTKEVSRVGGNTQVSSYVPQVFYAYLPHSITRLFDEVRAVRLENPTDQSVREAVAIPTLTALRLGGGSYDLRLLDDLVQRIHMTDLRVSGRKLDTRFIETLASLPRLHTLNLMKTNVNAAAIGQLDNLRSLQQLNLMQTDLRLSDLSRPTWADTIVELHLPRPESGASDRLAIESWASLEKLTINDFGAQLNPTPLAVRLADLPVLDELKLDQLQAYSLDLENLPHLARMDPLSNHWQSRIAKGGAIPGSLWMRRCHLTGLPKLSQLKIYATDLKSLRVTESPAIEQMLIGVYRKAAGSYDSRGVSPGASPYDAVSPESQNALIVGLGKSEGPALIDLDAVPIGGTNLSPLSNNKGIQTLYLSGTGVGTEQLKQLEGMDQLTYLRVGPGEVPPQDVGELLDLFPNLETLEFAALPANQFAIPPMLITDDESSDPVFRLKDRPKLKSLKFGQAMGLFFRDVVIENVPELAETLDFQWVGERFVLRDVPSLTGISVATPLPRQTDLSGLRDLNYFAGGGEYLNDEVIAELSACENLETLTLAYAGATGDALAKVETSNLLALFAPGCMINDDVVAKWNVSPRLEHLDLSHTEITAKSLPKLLQSGNLKSVTLDGCRIAADELAALATLGKLESLSLEEIGIDGPTLSTILQKDGLRNLNLSAVTIGDAVLDALLDHGDRVEQLVIRGCTINSAKLYEVCSAHRLLSIDPSGTDLDTDVYSRLLTSGRIREEAEYEMQRLMRSRQSSSQMLSPYVASTMFINGPSMIDTSAFAPMPAGDGFGTINAGSAQPAPPGFFQELFGFGSASSAADTTGDNEAAELSDPGEQDSGEQDSGESSKRVPHDDHESSEIDASNVKGEPKS